jgi:hypothetical protein
MNVEAATARYIDSLGAANLEKAAAYTNGNHWILLWNLVVAGLVTWLIIKWGLLDRIERRIAERGADFGFHRRPDLLPGVGVYHPALDNLCRVVPRNELWPNQPADRRLPVPDDAFDPHHGADRGDILMGVYWLIRRAGKRCGCGPAGCSPRAWLSSSCCPRS